MPQSIYDGNNILQLEIGETHFLFHIELGIISFWVVLVCQYNSAQLFEMWHQRSDQTPVVTGFS